VKLPFRQEVHAMARWVLNLSGRLVLGLAIGLVLGANFWAAGMILGGHSIADALHGRVEDALGKLTALIALGGLCGAGAGLGWGLVIANQRKTELPARAEK
jgi:hypothetical protein